MLALAACAMPLDPVAMGAVSRVPAMSGDLRRSLGILTEYGQATFIVLTALVIWALDPGRRRWLLDWLAAIVLTGAATVALKVLIGRPRPVLGDPFGFIGPLGSVDLGSAGVRSSWQVFDDSVAIVWSMPSNHAAFAAIMSVFLARHYPALTGIAAVLAGVVGFGRVAAGAHYPSDVLAGLLIGWVVAWPAIHRGWGVRALDRAWARLIDPDAGPAYPALARRNPTRPGVAGKAGGARGSGRVL